VIKAEAEVNSDAETVPGDPAVPGDREGTQGLWHQRLSWRRRATSRRLRTVLSELMGYDPDQRAPGQAERTPGASDRRRRGRQATC